MYACCQGQALHAAKGLVLMRGWFCELPLNPTSSLCAQTHKNPAAQARQLFRELPSLVDISIPDDKHFTVCGDVHGQFYDLLNIWELNGLPGPDNPYLFNGVCRTGVLGFGFWGRTLGVLLSLGVEKRRPKQPGPVEGGKADQTDTKGIKQLPEAFTFCVSLLLQEGIHFLGQRVGTGPTSLLTLCLTPQILSVLCHLLTADR